MLITGGVNEAVPLYTHMYFSILPAVTNTDG